MITTIRCATLVLAALPLVPPVHAAKDRFASVTIETLAARDHVYMLKGAGGNIGVSVGPDGVFLIDDQYAPLTERIVAAVAKLSPRPIRFVLNTHWHSDHTGGNETLGKAGAVLVAHDNVRQRMSKKQFMEFFNRKTPPAAPGALPIVTFNDRVTFHINQDTLEVVHVPHAHTDGDSILLFRQANVVHMGDVFFNGLYPFIDKSAGGSVDGVLAAIDSVLPRINKATLIIPGHGPIARKKDLLAYRAMLQTVRDRIAKMIEGGKTLAQIQAAKPTADYDPVWAPAGFIPPDRWVAMLHQIMTAR